MNGFDKVKFNGSEVDAVRLNGTEVWRKVALLSYTPLDYIQSSGTQWIDTGVKSTANMVYEMVFSHRETANGSLIGARNPNTGTIYGGYSMSLFTSASGISSIIVSTSTSQTTLRLEMISQQSATTIVDGVTKSVELTASTLCPQTIPVFCEKNGSKAQTFCKVRMYSIKFYSEGVLVLDLIPCINATNEVGMWDLVSETFFGNAGTGSFIAGTPQNSALNALGVQGEPLPSQQSEQLQALGVTPNL